MIYLDLDGPMVNWTKGVFDIYKEYPKLKPGQSAADALEITRTEMWSQIMKITIPIKNISNITVLLITIYHGRTR